MNRVERFAPLTVGILLAIPTLLAHYLPMSDLPLHEGAVGLLRHFGDPAYFPPDLYQLNLGHGNQLFHVTALLVSYFVGTQWAVKIVIATSQVLIMLTGARLADHVGRSRWSVVLLAPLVLGFTYYWGLVANLLGFAGFFAALPLIDRTSETPTLRSLGKLCLVLVFLFYAHESAFVIATAFTALLAIAHPLHRRLTALRLVPSLFAAVSFTTYFFIAKQYFTKGQEPWPMQWMSLPNKLRFLPADLFGSHDELTRDLLFVLGAGAIVGLAVARIKSKEERPAAGPSWLARIQAFVLHYRFEALGVGFILAVMIAPSTWNGATLLHARFLGPGWALLAITAAPRFEPPPLAKIAIAGVPLGILLLCWPQFVDADRTYRNLDSLIARIPKNSAVALASLDRPVYRTRVYSASTGPARAVADVGGRMSLSLVNSPLSPVQIRPQWRWDEFDARLFAFSSRALKPTHDLDRWEWVIAQSRDPAVRKAIAQGFQPDAELVAEEGEWLLLKSTHPQAPLASPEVRSKAGQETIAERVAVILRNEYDAQQRALGAAE